MSEDREYVFAEQPDGQEYVGEINMAHWSLAMDRTLAFRQDPVNDAKAQLFQSYRDRFGPLRKGGPGSPKKGAGGLQAEDLAS